MINKSSTRWAYEVMTMTIETCGCEFRGLVLNANENVVFSTVPCATREAAYRAAKELRAALVAALRSEYVPDED